MTDSQKYHTGQFKKIIISGKQMNQGNIKLQLKERFDEHKTSVRRNSECTVFFFMFVREIVSFNHSS